MKAYVLILLTLKYGAGDAGLIAGRTLLQKTLYFLSKKLNFDLEFVPHYYGPYSSTVADEIASLVSSGLIEENTEQFKPLSFGVTFEPRRYSYKLTRSGQVVTESLEKEYPAETSAIKKHIDKMRQLGALDDYRSLSIAAKMYHILNVEKKPMTANQIVHEAKALDWSIDKSNAENAISFLREMKFVAKAQ